jgi:hypothetical protein
LCRCVKRDLLRSYNFGANPYVVKPMGYYKFVEAINVGSNGASSISRR